MLQRSCQDVLLKFFASGLAALRSVPGRFIEMFDARTRLCHAYAFALMFRLSIPQNCGTTVARNSLLDIRRKKK